MKPIEGLAEAIVVAPTAREFVEAVGRTDRRSLSVAEREELRRVTQASDYDVRFKEVLDALAQLPQERAVTTQLDEFAADMLASADTTAWKSDLVDLVMPRLAAPLAYERLASLFHPSLRQAMPRRLRRSIRRVVGR